MFTGPPRGPPSPQKSKIRQTGLASHSAERRSGILARHPALPASRRQTLILYSIAHQHIITYEAPGHAKFLPHSSRTRPPISAASSRLPKPANRCTHHIPWIRSRRRMRPGTHIYKARTHTRTHPSLRSCSATLTFAALALALRPLDDTTVFRARVDGRRPPRAHGLARRLSPSWASLVSHQLCRRPYRRCQGTCGQLWCDLPPQGLAVTQRLGSSEFLSLPFFSPLLGVSYTRLS